MAGDSSSYFATIKPTDQLLSYLASESIHVDDEVTKQFAKPKFRRTAVQEIQFDAVRKLARSLQHNGEVHLHELLQNCKIVFHEPPRPPRNEELEARIQLLKRKFENDDYKRMIATVDATVKASKTNEFSSDVRMLRSHMAASVNFLVTVGACFLFGFKGSEYLFPAPKLAVQLLIGVVTGTIGALADLYFLVKHLEAEDRTKDQRR